RVRGAGDGVCGGMGMGETGGASDVVVDAWMTLAWIAAEDRDRYTDALRLAGVAGGVLERLGGNPRLEASLEDHLRVLHLDRHELHLARRHLQRRLALRAKRYGPRHAHHTASPQHIAMLDEFSGDIAKAIEVYHRARTIAEAELGPQHPEVLAMVSSEGSALYKSERFTDAIALLSPQLARAEQVAGPSSELAASF